MTLRIRTTGPQRLRVQVAAIGVPGKDGVGTVGPDVVCSVNVSAGMAVNIAVNGQAQPADATDVLKRNVAGVATTDALSGFTTRLANGFVALSSWLNATGSAALTAGAVYYLDPAHPGKLTTTAPTATGVACVRIGTAVSTSVLDVSIQTIQL